MSNSVTPIDIAPIRRRAIPITQFALRMLLGVGLLPYAISKLMQAQFQVGAYQYARPLGEIPGTILTWAFLGYSPWFQVLLGALEFIPAALLFFRRTQTIGALLALPMLLNVVLMNFALNLWPGTKQISVVLLALNIALLLLEVPKFRRALTVIMERSPFATTSKWNIAEIATGGVLLVLVSGFYFAVVSSYFGKGENDFIGRRQINRSGTFLVDTFAVAGNSVLPAQTVTMYFNFSHDCHWVFGSTHSVCQFLVGEANHEMQITGLDVGGGRGQIAGTYQLDGEHIRIAAKRDGQPVRIVITKHNEVNK